MAGFEEKTYHKPFQLSVWKNIFPFIKPYRKYLIAVVVINMLSAVIDIVIPLFQRFAIDQFIIHSTTDGMIGYAVVYALTITVQTVFVILFTRRSMILEMNVGRDLKRACFLHLQELSFSYYNVTPVGYLLSRVMSDTNRIAGMVAWGLIDILWAFFYVAGVFVAMAILNLRLALLILLIVPGLAVLTAYFQKKILHWNREIRRINAKITGAYNEGIMGAKTSKTLVIEESNYENFRAITQEMRIANVKSERLSAVYIPLTLFLSSAAVAIVLVQGGQMVTEDLLLIGTLSVFVSYAVGIFEPIQQLARNFAEVISVQANIERVIGLLEEKPGVTDTPEVIEKYGDSFRPRKENWEPIRGDIEFRDVTFRYPDGTENVLEHFNLKIPAGTTVAIVGETGAGKSTLVNLVCRFFEPTSGQILIDGRDYRERSQLWLHSNIGYVLQNPHLFSGTIRENIRYGRLEATDKEVEAAAESVSADTVAKRLENGYESDVGEGGDRLSTGEKQLVSFARAVLANPRIFVLDEATSSIDTATEQLIQSAISNLLGERTSFLIAHRLSTIRQADVILVVKDGRIIEQGKHRELMEKKGYYHTLYSRQFEEESAMRVLGGS